MTGIVDLRRICATLTIALSNCAIHFRREEAKHLAKDEMEKARANAIMASMCENALEKVKE